MQIVYTPLSNINEPDDPARLNIDQEPLQELVDSIRDRGLLQPILIKRAGDRFEIEAGHRRYLALRQLNWEAAPTIILGDTDENDLHIERAHENLIRQNLSVIEEAKMVNALVNENGRGVEETARLIKRSNYWVEQRLDLLGYQPEIVTALAESGITLSIAKELSKCDNPEYRNKLLEYVKETGATAKTVSHWVREASVEEFTEALDQAKQTGVLQQVAIGKTFMDCGICAGRFSTEELRHVFLCPTCIEGISKIREEYVQEQAQETGQPE